MDMNYLIEFGPFKTTIVEIIAVVFGLASVWSMKKESILAFPFGIINVLIYVYICFVSKLYAFASINLFFAGMSVYGWINWARKDQGDKNIRISRCSLKELILNSVALLAFFIILRIILVTYTDSVVPTWDSLTTAIYIIAMWMLARKRIENWIAQNTSKIKPSSAMRKYMPYRGCLKYTACGKASTDGSISLTRGKGCMTSSSFLAFLSSALVRM